MSADQLKTVAGFFFMISILLVVVVAFAVHWTVGFLFLALVVFIIGQATCDAAEHKKKKGEDK